MKAGKRNIRGKRRQSRRVLLQALYQWSVADSSYEDMQQLYEHEGSLVRADIDYFKQCLAGVMNNVDHVDQTYAPMLDRNLDQLTNIERACLRAGTYELLECADVPSPVVVNEWVELAKKFGAENSFRYVNAILDAVASSVREPPMSQ